MVAMRTAPAENDSPRGRGRRRFDGRRVEQQLILDRYRPLDELGEGGYGTVVLAWDTRMQRRVAIKRLDLPLDAYGDPQHDPPGLAEARTSAMLNHPSIVTVHDFATDSDEAFLIMEHVDGASLEELLEDLGGPLDLDETAAVFSAVSDALEFAHANGVLHLDIKPANVLVTRDGRVKVADFGMAALSSVTGHGSGTGGTVGYMPLEQLEGMRVGPETDEWALAALVYECLTAANPFDAESPQAAIVALETLETPAPSEYEPELGAAIDDVLLAALGLRPSDRYPSVARFADNLLPHLGDPAQGRTSLAGLVEAYAAEDLEDENEAPGWKRVGLWDRLQGRAGFTLLRAVAAVESAWLAWAGLAPLPVSSIAVLAGAALVGVAGALAPSLGTGLGLLAFAIGLFAQRLWLLASCFAIASALWWWFAARRSAGAAVLPLSAPVLAVARVPYAMPLLAGFALPPLTAAAAGFLGGALALLASASSGGVAPYSAVNPALFLDPAAGVAASGAVRAAFAAPAAWVALLGWAIAAAAMSWLSKRASRGWAIAGALLGAAIVYSAHSAARQLSFVLGHEVAWDGTSFLLSLGASLLLVVVVIALGAPVRAEEESVRPRRAAESDTAADS